MGMIKEFREFALKGNVIDMAVGVIIGGAFGTIVNSLINDLIMPVVGRAANNVDFSNRYTSLSTNVDNAMELFARTNVNHAAVLPLVEAKKIGPVFAYGNFITVLINFVILAFCIFMMVKAMNTLRKRFEQPSPPATKDCPQCTMKIPIAAKRCPQCTSELP